MKKTTLFSKIKSLMPVSRAAHDAAVAKEKTDKEWMLRQMTQTVRRNVALESVVAQHGIELDQE